MPYDPIYRKESYEFFKAHGICTRCTKEQAAPGKTMCFDCLEKLAQYAREYRKKEDPEMAKIERENRRKALYIRRKEAGLCIKCGKPQYVKDGKHYVHCYECWLARNRLNRKYSSEKSKHYKERGLCIQCGGKRVERRVLCADCLKKFQDNAIKNFSPYWKGNGQKWKKHWVGF